MKCNILGVLFDCYNFQQALEKACSFMDEKKPHVIVTPNPEIVMAAQKDEAFKQILNHADLVVPDGIGVVMAARLTGKKMPERVAGYDLVQGLFRELQNTNHRFYFLGGGHGVAEKAALEMKKKYPSLKIVGTHHGYLNEVNEEELIALIKKKSPDIILVGMGAPKQEKWIETHKEALGARLYVGVGGSFDTMSGSVKRAPAWMQKLGLEWFYRLLKQPARIGRIAVIPLFLWKAAVLERK